MNEKMSCNDDVASESGTITIQFNI